MEKKKLQNKEPRKKLIVEINSKNWYGEDIWEKKNINDLTIWCEKCNYIDVIHGDEARDKLKQCKQRLSGDKCPDCGEFLTYVTAKPVHLLNDTIPQFNMSVTYIRNKK
jgi:hypothetical protein